MNQSSSLRHSLSFHERSLGALAHSISQTKKELLH